MDRLAAIVAIALCTTGCPFEPLEPGDPDAPATIDSRPGEPDAPTAGRHVLITEVRTFGAEEFIELVNPSTAAVDLSDYFVTDLPAYWQLPGHVAGNLVLVAEASDFMVRFPPGTMIAPGQVIVIALYGPTYSLVFGTPDFTAIQPVVGAVPMSPSPVPNGGAETLSNTGEVVVVFRWDDDADLVADVDMVIAGDGPDPVNQLIAKAPTDGPDVDTLASDYATDAMTLQDMQADSNDNGGVFRSYKRIALEDGAEVATGGNGIGGNDETSEQLRATWDSQTSPTGYSGATPGTVPAF